MAKWCRIAAFLSSAFLLSPIPSLALDPASWPIKNGTLTGKGDKPSKDISGIACSVSSGFPRQCLVIDDNLQAAQALTLHDGWIEPGAAVPLIDDTFGGHRLELDGEGVAYADGVYYVIGSHGHPRDSDRKLEPVRDRDLIAARIKAASQIVRIQGNADGRLARLDPPWTLTDVIAAQPELQPFAGQRLDSNGVTIEGVAIDGDRLLAGFRGPVLPEGRAAVLSVSMAALGGSGPKTARLFKLHLGEGQGVRDLARFGDHILVLAGPVGEASGPYVVHLWDGATEDGSHPLRDITEIAGTGPKRKPEGLLPIGGDAATLKALVLFDGQSQGAPTAIDLPLK